MMTRLRDTGLPELVATARSPRHPERWDAFGEIVRRFRANAQASAYRLVRDVHLAQDVAQEAFLDAYLELARLRDPAAFPGWFRRIVFKHADRIRRRPQIRVAPLDVAEGIASTAPGPEAPEAEREDAVRLRRALSALPEAERRVVVLFYFAHQSHAEIGQRLALPVSTVKKRLHDARGHLRLPLDRAPSPERRSPEPPGVGAVSVTGLPGGPAALPPTLRGDRALTLATMDTAEGRAALLRYAPEQVASALQELSPSKQVAFLEMSERLPEIVPCLPEIALTQTIESVGLADAGWLTEFASPEQRVAAIDLDCWRDGRVSPARLFAWIDALIEAGSETLLASFDDIDAEIWILALKSMADFSIPSNDRDDSDWDPREASGPGGEDGLSDDGVVFYEPKEADHEERIREILGTARLYSPSLYWDFVYGAIGESARGCEAVAARWHAGRLNDLGFPDRERAMAVYRPLEIAALPALASESAPPAEETPVPDVIAGTLFARALSALPPERTVEIQQELFSVANAIAVADRLPLGRAASLEYALRKAVDGIDRGLAALASVRPQSLSELADTTAPRELFRLAATRSPDLRPGPRSLAELEDLESIEDELDWGVDYEWISPLDETLDSSGRLR